MAKKKYVSGRRGPKPMGDKPMTGAERQRRSRLKLAEEGGCEVMVRIKGRHMEAISDLAGTAGESKEEFLRDLLGNALERVVRIMHRCAVLHARGATDDEVVRFVGEYMYPKLPDIKLLGKTHSGDK